MIKGYGTMLGSSKDMEILRLLKKEPKTFNELVVLAKDIFPELELVELEEKVLSIMDMLLCKIPYLEEKDGKYFLTDIIDFTIDEYILKNNIDLPLACDDKSTSVQ